MIYNQNKITFDGTLLKQRFGFDFYEDNYKNTGVVVIFRGDMNISYDKDYFFNEYPVYSDSINICWEIPNLDHFGNIFFKKLFLYKIKESLYDLNIYSKTELDENDLIFVYKEDKKSKEINFCLVKKPDGVFSLGYIGLNNSNLCLNDKDLNTLCQKINDSFYQIINSSFKEFIKNT